MFERFETTPADPLLGLIAAFAADTRTDKVDLGVGVYKDDVGQTPVMQAVKQAETRLIETQASKSYLGPNGNVAFVDRMADLTFGVSQLSAGFVSGMQTPGGTAALRLAAELIKHANAEATVWLLDPTWANHEPIFRATGLEVGKIPFLARGANQPNMDAVISGLAQAKHGDAIVLHGSCHNPTGVEMTSAQWTALITEIERRGILPLVDQAYQGFGSGLTEDSIALNQVVKTCPDALVTVSCSKNFGLYRERTGALFIASDSKGAAERVRAVGGRAARGNYSMPPDHGAAVVAEILSDSSMRHTWETELNEMRSRLLALRNGLATGHPALASLSTGRGMFSLLPLSTDSVSLLRQQHGIYTAPDGRINIAGLTQQDVGRVAELLGEQLN